MSMTQGLANRRSVLRASLSLAPVLLAVSQALAATGKVSISVVDDASGKEIPARLVLRTSDGKYPGDRLVASGQQWPNIEAHALFIDGSETIEVPAGKTSITAAHGLEYKAESRTV